MTMLLKSEDYETMQYQNQYKADITKVKKKDRRLLFEMQVEGT